MYSNYSIPLFMSEYGCITNTRTFKETAELYKPEMTKVFSGGLVYEYSAEGNGYGIVTISGNSVTSVDSQFDDLKSALASVDNPSNGGGYSTDGKVQSCPEQQSDWDTKPFTGSALPAMPSGATKYMKNGAGDGPGLSGDGSQNAGGGSSSTASTGAGSVTATYGNGVAASTGSASGSGSSSSASNSAASPMHMARADFAPLMCGVLVFASMMFGAALL